MTSETFWAKGPDTAKAKTAEHRGLTIRVMTAKKNKGALEFSVSKYLSKYGAVHPGRT